MTIPMQPLTFQAQPDRYLQPHQARTRPPTNYEDLLGDSIERAFGDGVWELDALIVQLNRNGPMGPNGQPWTVESFQTVVATLGL
jgi:hypothetical protein